MLETPEHFWVITFAILVFIIFFMGPLLVWISSLKYNKEIKVIVKHMSKTLLRDLELKRIVVISHEPHLPLVIHKYLIDEIYIRLGKGVFGDVSFEMAGDQLFVSRDVEMYKNSFRGFI